MNTQRPEWNDANNALVGNGVSMVTLYYIRRYLTYCEELFGALETDSYEMNQAVTELLRGIAKVFDQHTDKLERTFNDGERKEMVDALGLLGEAYRAEAYQGFLCDSSSICRPRHQIESQRGWSLSCL